MKVCKMIKAFAAFFLSMSLFALGVGCGNFVSDSASQETGGRENQTPVDAGGQDGGRRENLSPDGEERLEEDGEAESGNLSITSAAARAYIRKTVAADLQESMSDATVDYVECVYLSQEYVDELYYNSLNNVYFGYDYDEVASYMQDQNWTFTVDEQGQTAVREAQASKSALIDVVKKVSNGTGVILICAVVSVASAGLGVAPVACFFAGAAHGALIGAVSGAAVGGVISGAMEGVRTKNWEDALKGAMEGAADGYQWGAVAGSLVGGFVF